MLGQNIGRVGLPDMSAGGRPSLTLDFVSIPVLNEKITFTRTGTTATYFNSAGVLTSAGADVPRFDYNPATLAAQGLLIEEARTNLALYSAKLDQFSSPAVWALTGAGATLTATTDIAAPDGTMTAWTLTSSGASAQIQQAPAVVASTTYTGSFWIRRRSGTGTINIRVVENVNTPLAGVTSQWQRFNFTATSTSTTGRLGVFLSGTSDAVDIWGAQLEAGAFPTSYIPTTTTALTRSEDRASVNTLSPWYNATGSTIYAEWVRNAPVAASDFPRGVDFINTSTTDKVSINHLNNQTSSTSQTLYPSGLSWPFSSISGLNPTLGLKTAIAFQVGSARYAVNGTLGGSDYALASIPTFDQVVLGSGEGFLSNSTLNGWLRRVTYYPRRLTNAELQAITTP